MGRDTPWLPRAPRETRADPAGFFRTAARAHRTADLRSAAAIVTCSWTPEEKSKQSGRPNAFVRSCAGSLRASCSPAHHLTGRAEQQPSSRQAMQAIGKSVLKITANRAAGPTLSYVAALGLLLEPGADPHITWCAQSFVRMQLNPAVVQLDFFNVCIQGCMYMLFARLGVPLYVHYYTHRQAA